MHMTTLIRPAHRFLCERLDGLRQALIHLGQRLREAVAHLLGSHVGEAVQDALASALRLPSCRIPESYPDWEESDYFQGFHNDDGGDHDPWSDSGRARPQPRTQCQRVRWQNLLPGVVPFVYSWLPQPLRSSLLCIVGVGAAASVTLLLAGPLFGGLVAVAGMAYFLRQSVNTATKPVAG